MKIFLMGQAGSGKDTVADYLVTKHGYKKFRLAQAIENLCRLLFGMEGKDRRLMIDTGEKAKEIFGNDFWLRVMEFRLNGAEKDLQTGKIGGIVISDVRFPVEYDYFVREGYYPVRVLCNTDKRIERLAERDGDSQLYTLDDKTERQLHFDVSRPAAFYLENCGSLENLYKQVDALLEGVNRRVV